MKPNHLFHCAIAGLVFLATSCHSESLLHDHKLVKVYQRLPVIPHGTDSYRIMFGGKSYNCVYGGSYLIIPEKGLICFRTEPPIGASWLHLVPTGSGAKEFKVKLGEESSFGHSLGMDKNDVVSTYVDKVEGDRIFFTEQFYKRGYNRYRLDLVKHTLVKIEEHETNGPGQPQTGNKDTKSKRGTD